MINGLSERLYNWINPWGTYEFGQSAVLSLSWFREKLFRFYFWSNRQRAVRYIPVIKMLKTSFDPETLILEIGSGCLGIAPYTSHNIVGLDKNTAGPRFPNMTLVNGDATNLPFQDNAFDLVCSLDMLEHIPSNARHNAVVEICRVARKVAIIGVPCGEGSEACEKKARRYYSDKIRKYKSNKWKENVLLKRNRYLFEHLDHGLPDCEDILDYLSSYEQQTNTPCTVQVTGNESRFVWYMGALGHMRFSNIRWTITTLLFILLYPLASRAEVGGYYRKVFVINKRLHTSSSG